MMVRCSSGGVIPIDFDLKQLSGMYDPGRGFLSVYLTGAHSLEGMEKRLHQMRRVLTDDPAVGSERERFDENVKLVWDYLEKNPVHSATAIFAGAAQGFFKSMVLPAPVLDLIRIDTAPYIRPLAELGKEYATSAVVVADNKKARIFTVTALAAKDAEVIRGNVKNHVKVGGWSQQRYERRRDKQLLAYARTIVEALEGLEKQERMQAIILVGGREILQAVHENLPPALLPLVVEKAVDLSHGDELVNRELLELFAEQELRTEREHWEAIRDEYLRGGRAVIGMSEVLWAVKAGRIENLVVHHTYDPSGKRCRSCQELNLQVSDTCTSCGSQSLFEVKLVNEIVEMLLLTGGEAFFLDFIKTLAEAGDIAAMLRY